MPDTLQIKHFYQTLVCDDFQRRWKQLSFKRNPTWIYNSDSSETLPNLTMVNTPDGIWHLSSEVCLPKLLYGHNARLPNQTEVIEAVQKQAGYTQAVSGLPFDAETATVSLIHYAKDIYLGEPGVWRMLEKLSKRKLPGFLKMFIEDSTIYFTSKGKSKLIRIYSKLNEVLKKQPTKEAIEYARGNLRVECCLLKPYSINSLVKRLSLPDKTTQSLLREDVEDFEISRILENLNFFELLENEKTALQILEEHFPMKKAMRLRGFLQAVSEHGENFYKDESHGIKKDSYYRDARACRKAKVW